MSEIKDLLGEISAVMSKIEAKKVEDIEDALQRGTCPHCAGGVVDARHSGFIEADKGLTERLIATCAAGHEWAVREPAFRWEGQNENEDA